MPKIIEQDRGRGLSKDRKSSGRNGLTAERYRTRDMVAAEPVPYLTRQTPMINRRKSKS